MALENVIVKQIPLQKNIYNYEFNIATRNTNYILRIYYNRRAEQWTIDIKDEDNNPIVMSIPLLIGAQLTKRFVNEKLSDIKYLLLSNDRDRYIEATEDSLGDTCNLYYMYELNS